MRQTTGDILSVGLELFLNEFSTKTHLELKSLSNNRLDLKIISVNQNDSGIYTCMLNDDKLTSFSLEILGKNSNWFELIENDIIEKRWIE